MRRVIPFGRMVFLLTLGSILSGCMSFGSSNMTINSDGHRKIVIKHPTGKYQPSHNIFMPYQESVEIYTIVLLSQEKHVDAENIIVYKFSDLSRVNVTGKIEISCETNESYADIKLYTDKNEAFVLNGKYSLNVSC